VFKSAWPARQQVHLKPAMSNPNDLLIKALCHYLTRSQPHNEWHISVGRTFNGLL